ncbi:HAD family hydrolase [Pararhizobium haloflavum]|uniref:HAD family hydrolase n=1 Tax=Pararhizobium haloflavum TaxID=2037914 RepID=UPI0012FFDCB2|nr:HAD family hydrolase [Pararhizobium haloflavum]
MRNISAILFDKDGTLLDFAATWGPATAAVLRELSAGDDRHLSALADMAGFDHAEQRFRPDSPVIAGDPDSFAPGWAAQLGVAYDAAFSDRVNRLFREESLVSLKAFEDVSAVLDHLAAAGLRIGLATNDAAANAHAHLERMGVADRFDFIAGYDSGHGAKPGPGMIRAFAEACDIETSAVAMVGDTLHDIEAARNAGALAIAIARDETAMRALEGHADIMIGELNALVEWVRVQHQAAG